VLIVRGHPVLPDDEYGLTEAYCVEPGCDCRRVMLNVVSRRQMAFLASISYGFDRDEEWAGPFLDPLNPQSQYAGVLLDLVTEMLANPDYVARLESHYYAVKDAVADPNHPAQRVLAQLEAEDRRRPPRRQARKRKPRGR
jgi:hypothetical protein